MSCIGILCFFHQFCLCCPPPLFQALYSAAQVACRPALSPLTFDAVPSNLLPYSCISRALDAKEWTRLQAVTFEQYGDQYVLCLLAQLISHQAACLQLCCFVIWLIPWPNVASLTIYVAAQLLSITTVKICNEHCRAQHYACISIRAALFAPVTTGQDHGNY